MALAEFVLSKKNEKDLASLAIGQAGKITEAR
jgi:hypothetical protein